MDRRRFLKRGLVGGALLAVGGGGWLALKKTAPVAPRVPLRALDERAFAVLVAVAARMVPVEGAQPLLVAHGVDLALALQSPEAQKDLSMALALLESGLLGLFTRGSTRLFTELGPDEQDGALASWQHSRVTLLRAAFTGLKRLCTGAHYAVLENAKAVGYPGPRFMKPDPPPIVADGPLSPPMVMP